MLKKLTISILTLSFLLSFSACASTEESAEEQAKLLQEISPEAEYVPGIVIPDETENSEENPVETAEPPEVATPEVPDFIDLTEMSETMVYSYVYDMLIRPTEYLGKTVKVHGKFNEMFFEANGMTYTFVIVADATGCCAQGLEFVVNSDVEFPAQDTEIEVIGVFEDYERGDFKYTRLAAEEITILQ